MKPFTVSGLFLKPFSIAALVLAEMESVSDGWPPLAALEPNLSVGPDGPSSIVVFESPAKRFCLRVTEANPPYREFTTPQVILEIQPQGTSQVVGVAIEKAMLDLAPNDLEYVRAVIAWPAAVALYNAARLAIDPSWSPAAEARKRRLALEAEGAD